MVGTLVNMGAILAGGTLGLLLHTKLPTQVVKTVFQGVGLFTLLLGVYMGLKSEAFILIVFSLLFGAVTGEGLQLERRMETLSERLKTTLKLKNERFSEGLISSFLLFCMGSMTILGAFEEGLGSPPNLLFAKSVLDGFAAMAFAASLGIGVLFSVIPLLLYQGGLTIFAAYLSYTFTEPMIDNLTAVGGILLIGLGLQLVEIKKIKVLNLLPALVFIVVLTLLFG